MISSSKRKARSRCKAALTRKRNDSEANDGTLRDKIKHGDKKKSRVQGNTLSRGDEKRLLFFEVTANGRERSFENTLKTEHST